MFAMRVRFYCGLRIQTVHSGPVVVSEQLYFAVMDRNYKGWTCYNADGCWEGHHEPSIILETVVKGRNSELVMAGAKRTSDQLREVGMQDEVWYTVEEIRLYISEA